MKNRYKKSALMIMLSAMLATSGCSTTYDKLSYKDNSFEKVEDLMNNIDFYQEKYAGETNEEFFSPFYNQYLNNFLNYMSEDQYNTFLEMVSQIDDSERYDFPKVYSYLMDITEQDSNYGHGFYYAFNTRIIFESLFSAYDLRDDTYTHVNTLRDIVNNDDAFYQSVFSGDIDNVIDCIMENTSFSDRALVEEMMLKFDLYVENKESATYLDKQIKEESAARIQEIMNMLVASKCQNDEEFANTFYGRMLNDSRYYNQDKIELTRYLIEDTFELTQEDENGYLVITIPNEYYFSDMTLEEIKKEKLLSVISKGLNEEKSNVLSLLSFLIHEETLNNISTASTADEMREYLYNDLSSYFPSEDNFNDFCLRLYNGTSYGLETYFRLFKSRIKEDGISLLDFIRYYSLVELNKENTYNHYEFYDGSSRMDYDDLRKLKEEEYEDIAYNYPENYFLYNINYLEEFASIEQLLSQNDLGFKMMYNSSQKISWYTGSLEDASVEKSLVLSELVEPQMIDYAGNNFIYYECPKGYEDGQVVDAFLNIDKELTLREQSGFISEIINPETGESMFVYLVGINDDLANYQSLRFITEYSNVLNKDKEQKKLTYEVDYE